MKQGWIVIKETINFCIIVFFVFIIIVSDFSIIVFFLHVVVKLIMCAQVVIFQRKIIIVEVNNDSFCVVSVATLMDWNKV